VRGELARCSAGVLFWLTITATVVTASSADVAPQVRGPATVSPGRIVAFRAHGFRAGSLLEVTLAPADKPSCCAIRIASSFPVSDSGDAALTFRMPVYYRRCRSTRQKNCPKIRWNPRERVVVNVFGYLQQATTVTSVRS
jgi:hypothetical protein